MTDVGGCSGSSWSPSDVVGLLRATPASRSTPCSGPTWPTLYRMWEGEIDLLDAVKAGRVELTGPRWIVSGLPRWLQLSPVAPYVRAARADGATGRSRRVRPVA